MNDVGEALAEATTGEWGVDLLDIGLDLQDMAGNLLACIKQPTKEDQ